MENIKQVGGNEELVGAFDAVSKAELVEQVKAMLTPEEIASFGRKDFELVFNVARRYLERNHDLTVQDALIVGAAARTEALKMLGSSSMDMVFVGNTSG